MKCSAWIGRSSQAPYLLPYRSVSLVQRTLKLLRVMEDINRKSGLLTGKSIFPNGKIGIKPSVDQKMAGFCKTLVTEPCNETSWPLDGMMPSY